MELQPTPNNNATTKIQTGNFTYDYYLPPFPYFTSLKILSVSRLGVSVCVVFVVMVHRIEIVINDKSKTIGLHCALTRRKWSKTRTKTYHVRLPSQCYTYKFLVFASVSFFRIVLKFYVEFSLLIAWNSLLISLRTSQTKFQYINLFLSISFTLYLFFFDKNYLILSIYQLTHWHSPSSSHHIFISEWYYFILRKYHIVPKKCKQIKYSHQKLSFYLSRTSKFIV